MSSNSTTTTTTIAIPSVPSISNAPSIFQPQKNKLNSTTSSSKKNSLTQVNADFLYGKFK